MLREKASDSQLRGRLSYVELLPCIDIIGDAVQAIASHQIEDALNGAIVLDSNTRSD